MKQQKEIIIFQKQTEGNPSWKDIKHLNLEDDDKINAGHFEGYYSENNSWDPYWEITISRMVDETDEEQTERLHLEEHKKNWSKELRRKSYLRLRSEFENEDI